VETKQDFGEAGYFKNTLGINSCYLLCGSDRQ